MDLLSLSARFAIDKTDYDRAIDEASKSAQEFGDEFDSVSDSISSNVDMLEGDYKTLADAMGDTTSEADGMDDSLNGVVSTVGDVSGEVSSFTSEVDSAATSMSDAAGEAVTMSDSVGTLNGETSDAGGSMFDFGDIASTVAGIFTGDFSSAISGAIDMVKDLATELWNGMNEMADYGDQVDKESQKLGISTDAYEEWSFVLEHSGTSIGSLRKGMMQITTAMDEMRAASKKTIDTTEVNKLKKELESASLSAEEAQKSYAEAVKNHGKNSLEARKAALKLRDAEDKAEDAYTDLRKAMEGTSPELGKAATAIQQLGVAVTDSSGNMRAQEDIFKDVIFALQDIEDETQRTAIAQDIFGRSVMELNPLLNTSSEETAEMIDRVRELGGVLSEDAVNDSVAFKDALTDFNTAVDGLKHKVMSVFLPIGTHLIEFGTKIVVGVQHLGDGIKAVIDGIGEFFKTVFGKLGPEALEWGKDMLDSFLKGLKDAWESVKSWVLDKLDWVKAHIHFSKPDEGPLKDFDTYAPDMVKLFTQGLEDNKKLVASTFEDVFSMPAVAADSATFGAGETFTTPRSTPAATQAQQINLILDNTVIGRALLPYIRAEEVRVGVDLAGVM